MIGLTTPLGWLLHIDRLVEPIEHKAPIMFNEGLCFLAIGMALLGRDSAQEGRLGGGSCRR